MRGTHEDDVRSLAATHTPVSVRGASVVDLAGDTIRHNCDDGDVATTMRQIGLLPDAAPA